MSRVQRNKFIERWSGREWALRQCAADTAKQLIRARTAGDVENAALFFGQDAGLIDSVESASEIVRQMITQAEEIISGRLSSLLRKG
jgi:NAD(P)H-dependent flavin oxidoreductase YrpB (nitropropane dioxygenase family)